MQQARNGVDRGKCSLPLKFYPRTWKKKPKLPIQITCGVGYLHREDLFGSCMNHVHLDYIFER